MSDSRCIAGATAGWNSVPGSLFTTGSSRLFSIFPGPRHICVRQNFISFGRYFLSRLLWGLWGSSFDCRIWFVFWLNVALIFDVNFDYWYLSPFGVTEISFFPCDTPIFLHHDRWRKLHSSELKRIELIVIRGRAAEQNFRPEIPRYALEEFTPPFLLPAAVRIHFITLNCLPWKSWCNFH